MIEELPTDVPGVGVFKASEKLTDADYQKFISQIESLIKEYGRISLFLELENFRGWESKAIWDDFKIGQSHPYDFERIAIVGEQTWERWITLLAKPFTHAKIRYFKYDRRNDAWGWLKENALSAIQQQPTAAPYQQVLIAIDFSTQAAQVLHRGLALASREGAKISLIHVVDAPIFEDDSADYIFPRESRETARQIELANIRLRRLAELAGTPKALTVCLSGNPKMEISRYAEKHNIDLIVVGSHGQSRLTPVLGSTAAGLLAQAPADVLVVS